VDKDRVEQGAAAHFCCASECLYGRSTYLPAAGLIVSTVGNWPRGEIGYKRHYETMVFPAEQCSCGCGMWLSNVSGGELDADGVEEPRRDDLADAMHEDMVRRVLSGDVKARRMNASDPMDAYTSVEAALFAWFTERGLYPGRLEQGDILDLAVKMSAMVAPFRDFYRAHAGYDGYDLETTQRLAEEAERE